MPKYKSSPKREPETSTVKPYPYRSIEELLLAVREGRACNKQTHEAQLVKLAPGASTRCPNCNKNISAAPKWKCVHGGVKMLGCEICRDAIAYEEAALAAFHLQEERVERQ